MYRTDSHADWTLAAVVAVAFLVLAFSRALGVNFDTGAQVLGYATIYLGLAGLALYAGLPWRWVVPALLAGLWMAFWPALDYATTTDFERQLGHRIFGTPWYGSWMFKLAGLLGAAAIYAFAVLLKRD